MAKLVDVYNTSKILNRRQLPLVIDEALTMVMDLKSIGLVSENHQIRGKELDDFLQKINLLNENELNRALEVTRSEILKVLNQAVPCVGCRRSVERLYYQLFKYGYPTLDPLVVKNDGIITVREDKQNSPQFLCNLFHGHSTRLNRIVDSQPRRSKKSHRCLLHSLDAQRNRPMTPSWRDVWDCMRLDCKRKVCTIDEASLFAALETYLRKHRFCGECRTKVLNAYNMLIEDSKCPADKSPSKLPYDGITHCKSKHVHLNPETDVVPKLIGRAEPELAGSRRERHAKTLEIAQEEVLTCIGICVYERLHRIYARMREEECTCRVFAAVAIDALWRSFETAVERKRGVSQLELLYAELARTEERDRLRREQKKLKRKRKKEKLYKSTCKEVEEDANKTDHSHDGGYSSENNNGFSESSLPSSPDGSEVACPDGCCESETDYIPYNRFTYGNGRQLSLQEMLDDHFYSDDDSDCYITPEEVQEFKINNTKVYEMRKELRETLKKRFAQLCVNGPPQVPRLLTPTKFFRN